METSKSMSRFIVLLGSLLLNACVYNNPVHSQTADLAYQVENWQQAAALYQKLSQSGPNRQLALFRLGNSHAQLDQYQQAIKAYQNALAISDYSAARHNLALVYIRLGAIELQQAYVGLPDSHATMRQDRELIQALFPTIRTEQ